MAVTETIQELLQGIDEAQYGREMRQFIHKGIQKCYEEGSAGETDLTAREQIEDLDAMVGEWYHLPVTISEEYSASRLDNYVVLNPKTKMMLVRVNVDNQSDTQKSAGTLLTGLPIHAMPNRLVYSTYVFIPLIAQDSASTGVPFKTDYIGTAILQHLYSGNTFQNQSAVVLRTAIPAHTRLYGSILVPYFALSAEHPISEATLIAS